MFRGIFFDVSKVLIDGIYIDEDEHYYISTTFEKVFFLEIQSIP